MVRIIFGYTYRTIIAGEETLIRFYPISETPKAIGVLRVHKWNKLPQKIAPYVYETSGGTRAIELGRHDGEGFLMTDPNPHYWFPKSQCEVSATEIVIPGWLARKYNLHLLEEVE